MIALDDHRQVLIHRLFALSSPLVHIMSQLAMLGWDYTGAPVQLSKDNIASILRRYLAGELSAQEVEAWAECVEGRDDISAAPSEQAHIDTLIYRLANPALTHPLDHAQAKLMLAEISDG